MEVEAKTQKELGKESTARKSTTLALRTVAFGAMPDYGAYADQQDR